MPPKKISNPEGYWFIILSLLLVVLIFFIGVLIYIIYTKKPTHVLSCPISQTQSVEPEKIIHKFDLRHTTSSDHTIQKQQENIPVYPNKLPQYDNKEYQQVGILTANETDKEPIVLPLFARKLRNNKERWQYYTATDKNNMMRLPIRHDNAKCEDDIGCKEIYDGDSIFIEIYQGRTFTATIYKVDAPRYFAEDY